jgi:hypothetical protein
MAGSSIMPPLTSSLMPKPLGDGGANAPQAVADAWVEDEFTAGAGQTVFNLSALPLNNNTLSVFINGVRYDDVDDFTIVGQVLTWTDALFTLDAGMEVIIRYIG